MAEARSRENWAHTSSLLAMLANVNRDPKKTKPFKPSDFDPYGSANKSAKPVIRKGEDFDILKMVFVDEQKAQTGKKGTGL